MEQSKKAEAVAKEDKNESKLFNSLKLVTALKVREFEQKDLKLLPEEMRDYCDYLKLIDAHRDSFRKTKSIVFDFKNALVRAINCYLALK